METETTRDSSQEEDEGARSDDGEEYDEEEEKEDEDLVTEVVIFIKNKKTGIDETFRVLLDSGAKGCIATKEAIKRAGIDIQPSKKK
jgi:hypothetical protein